LRKSLELDPRNLSSHQELARLFAREGRTEEAKSAYLAALRLAPAPSLHYELGQLYSNNSLLDDAVREFHAAVNLDPNNAG
jgi:Tfp pilus assembly protein PilF